MSNRSCISQDDAPGTLVVEDNALIAAELFDVLEDAGLRPYEPCTRYLEAMRMLTRAVPAFCVLDLDLSEARAWHQTVGSEGRKLLSVLALHGCRTVVYSGSVISGNELREFDANVEVVRKTEPVEEVVLALKRMEREAGRR